MNKTGIEYLTHTWNPIAMRCTYVSEGCRECWHLTVADKLSKNPKISRVRRGAYIGEKPILKEDELNAPLRMKKPAIIGVQFMGDLFHGDVDWTRIDQIFDIIYNATWHTFIILTKRIEAAWYYFNSPVYRKPTIRRTEYLQGNVWLGVTCENQKAADKRIHILSQIPAAVHWISHEPALGPIIYPPEFLALGNQAWLVSGGESGKDAKPSHPDWFRQDRDQCQAAGVHFFFKQYGEYVESIPSNESSANHHIYAHDTSFYRVGKKKAGRILDDRTWDEYPNNR